VKEGEKSVSVTFVVKRKYAKCKSGACGMWHWAWVWPYANRKWSVVLNAILNCLSNNCHIYNNNNKFGFWNYGGRRVRGKILKQT